jgi:hypothetical protein
VRWWREKWWHGEGVRLIGRGEGTRGSRGCNWRLKVVLVVVGKRNKVVWWGRGESWWCVVANSNQEKKKRKEKTRERYTEERKSEIRERNRERERKKGEREERGGGSGFAGLVWVGLGSRIARFGFGSGHSNPDQVLFRFRILGFVTENV